VADDDKSLCDNLCEVLSDHGYEVCAAYDGEQAVSKVGRSHIDILLLDMKMPRMNGLEVFQRVKALQPGIAAIIITGYAMEMKGLIQQCMEENAFAYLAKPLEISRLVELIKQITVEKVHGANPDGS
jgi:CheY-like chemotaxis protein